MSDTKGAMVSIAPQGKAAGLVIFDDSDFENLLDTGRFEHIWRVANVFSKSGMVPKHFVNNPEGCFVGIQMAVRLKVDPFMLLQNIYMSPDGKPALYGQMAIALINARGPFDGQIQFAFVGTPGKDDYGCTAWGIDRRNQQRCEVTVTIATAKAEGWHGRNPKWKNIPEMMLRYRAGAWLGRAYAPECLMGMLTTEEAEDTSAPSTQRIPRRPTAETFVPRATQQPQIEGGAGTGPVTIDQDGVVTEGDEQTDEFDADQFKSGLLSLIKGATTVDALNVIMEHAEEELARLDADSRGEMHTQANARKKDLWDAEEAARKAAETPKATTVHMASPLSYAAGKPAQATVAPPPPPAATGAAASPAPDDLMGEPYTPAKGDALEYRIRTRFNACQTKGALQSAMRENAIGQALGHLFMKDKPRHKAIMATKDEMTRNLPDRLPAASKEGEKINTGAATAAQVESDAQAFAESENPAPPEHRPPADVQQPQAGLALGGTETVPSAETWPSVVKSKLAAIAAAPDEDRVQAARNLSTEWRDWARANDDQGLDDIWRAANDRIRVLREGKA